MRRDCIAIEGAHQNNLKDLDLELPLGKLIVITGVSGSGKSSLAFDTIYAEGQRRYVETFSPYARQFLERMDKPQVARIDGIPPAIAIDQTNPVRTSRSTVGTMTELNDHIKLLFARAAGLYCHRCGRAVRRDTPQSIFDELCTLGGGRRALVTFAVDIPDNFDTAEVERYLAAQGYTRIHRREGTRIEVIQDRVRLEAGRRERIVEALEAALKYGHARVTVYPLDTDGAAGERWRYSSDLHCAACDIAYQDAVPNLFSFNSPLGACPSCRGFGRTIGIDDALVVPDTGKTLAEGAMRPWQSPSYRECQDDLMRFAKRRGIPTDVPWRRLGREAQRWVFEGEGDWDRNVWYGVRRFFAWLETKAYKMHIRVLLSKYRSYNTCETCHGARLKPEALWWRLGNKQDAARALAGATPFRPAGISLDARRFSTLPGLTIHDVMLLPLARCREFFARLELPAPLDEASAQLLTEVRSRLRYLEEVGLGYLTLDRQSRTLSGGEVQRINLTTALGTALVNTLFVLDEPSIGLHPRDIHRLVAVLQRLRDAGNSLIVVEHDPQVMVAADRIIDLGPGPGERGGEIVFDGTARALLRARRSLTGAYLSGRLQVSPPGTAVAPGEDTPHIEIRGARAHNLKNIDVRIPLGRLVCITGVSGSGKSTLVQDVLYRALVKIKGKPLEPPGAHSALRGHRHIDEVVLVDQAPIGKTARSNPASYVGALDAIRKLFAALPLALERGYTAGTFSFNSGTGRCPTCNGSGFEHVEMQFLSDVYLRCPDCDGRRYRAEVLEVKRAAPASAGTHGRAHSMAEVLEMTVTEALAFFEDCPDVAAALAPLLDVGLDYLKLGQPVPTLSGGEAQRLKLAGHLVRAPRTKNSRRATQKGTLFLFDEPTTGLHFADIARLLGAFRQLIAAGHSLVVIEHNLDVMRAADWIIDLGPEGGEAGGRIVCEGTPKTVAAHEDSHTAAALRADSTGASIPALIPAPKTRARAATARGSNEISVLHAREHNLRDIDLHIPRDRFTVITGVSGSGKSTVAFDILFAEGQRRYLESLNAYARQFVQPAARPDVDAILGIPPTVAIEQRTSRGGRKSTVATLTECYHFLRLLFVKLGTQYCPDCDIPIESQTAAAILAQLQRDHRGKTIEVLAPLVTARKGYYTELAQWARQRGFAALRVDGRALPTDAWPRLDRYKEHDIELPLGEITVAPRNEARLRELLTHALEYGRDTVMVVPQGELRNSSGRKATRDSRIYSTRRTCRRCARGFAELDPRLFSYNSKHGWCPRCYGTGLRLAGFDEAQSGEEIWWNAWWEGAEKPCPVCDGRRLRPEALAVRFRGRNIAEYNALPVAAAGDMLRKLKLKGREAEISRDIVAELKGRLAFLQEVGLGYLSLDRAAPTLSGGEAQRIRLAAQLGSNLRGVCYILDEPTIGLHARDNRMLLDTLAKLRHKGNTVVVVEHDEETIRRADHVVDLGPGAGVNGGRVVAAGTVKALLRAPESITGRFLATPLAHPVASRRTVDKVTSRLVIHGARLNNLRRLRVALPLGRLVCVTGVSGSGKSTLVRQVLHENLYRVIGRRRRGTPVWHGCREISGWERIGRILEVDQTPIGKTPRSCSATYIGVWDAIRRLYATSGEARIRGYGPGRFSFNVRGGRCEVCEGQGIRRIEMSFLPDVKVTCEACGGARFTPDTLAVLYRGRSIGEVLAMSVDEAVEFFSAHVAIHHALRLLQDVGLGYLTLGQPSPTLSGGEAQRIKLVTELAKVRGEGTGKGRTTAALYVLDEPTVGLHMADVAKLIDVLHRLVAGGNSVVVIEHNLDVIAEADWVIDLGPEGGDGGGRIVAQGAPESIAARRSGARDVRSHTARALASFLKTQRRRRT